MLDPEEFAAALSSLGISEIVSLCDIGSSDF